MCCGWGREKFSRLDSAPRGLVCVVQTPGRSFRFSLRAIVCLSGATVG